MEQKLNYKTLNKLNEIPVVSSTLATTGGLYQYVKEKNFVTRNALNLVEFSAQTFTKLVVSPLAAYYKEPIGKADEYLSSKVEFVSETTDTLAQTLKGTYSTQKTRFDRAKKFSIDTYNKAVAMTTMLFAYLNTFLETPLVKAVSEPVLNLVESGINHVLSIQEAKQKGENETTLNRVFSMNQKVYNKLNQQLRNVMFQKADMKLN